MFARSGLIPAPCGVPSNVSRHSRPSITPARSHRPISRQHASVGHPMRDHPQHPLVVHRVEEAPYVRVVGPMLTGMATTRHDLLAWVHAHGLAAVPSTYSSDRAHAAR